MHKADIARHIHQQAGISETESAQVLEWFVELLKTTLKAGESIAISGFGKFTVRSKRARQGRNPRTGEAVTISAAERELSSEPRSQDGNEFCRGRPARSREDQGEVSAGYVTKKEVDDTAGETVGDTSRT